MRPGDLIEWTYKRDKSVVDPHERLWSTPMQRYVPIGGLNLLIGFAEGTITWLCEKGLFHAREDDAAVDAGVGFELVVVPRVRG